MRLTPSTYNLKTFIFLQDYFTIKLSHLDNQNRFTYKAILITSRPFLSPALSCPALSLQSQYRNLAQFYLKTNHFTAPIQEQNKNI